MPGARSGARSGAKNGAGDRAGNRAKNGDSQRRSRDPKATRADILETSCALLARDGPEAISLRLSMYPSLNAAKFPDIAARLTEDTVVRGAHS